MLVNYGGGDADASGVGCGGDSAGDCNPSEAGGCVSSFSELSPGDADALGAGVLGGGVAVRARTGDAAGDAARTGDVAGAGGELFFCAGRVTGGGGTFRRTLFRGVDTGEALAPTNLPRTILP